MFNNVKAKKRLTQVLVAFVIICMSVTGSFLLLEDSIDTVHAEERKITDAAGWNNAMSAAANGGEWTITLDGDITVTGKLSAVPAGAKVTLKMNNHSINWNDTGSGNNNIMSTSYPFSDNYWGTITNKGTLNIEGTGTISSFHTRIGYKNGDKKDNYGVKHAAIVNTGTLTIGSNITVKSYTAMSHESGTAFQDMFVYTHGVYNVGGTLNSGGTIKAGSFSQGVVAGYGGSNAWAIAFSYGVYGGTVNVTGGNIYSEAKSGFTNDYGGIPPKGNKAYNYAFGIFADSPVILGKTTITTKSTSWRCNNKGQNLWGDGGANASWGVGVMYSGNNYPVIGPSVNINASFQMAADSTTISFPEYDTAVGSWTRNSNSGPANYGRYAYAVAKSNVAVSTAAMYGGQSSEVGATDAVGTGVSTAPTAGVYRSEYAMRNNLTNTVSSSDNYSHSGGNSNETKTSKITNGAPGSGGAQYMVVYRYFKGSRNMNYLQNVSYTPDTTFINDRAVMKISGTENNNGVATDAANAVAYSKGGTVKNENFYELAGKYYYQDTLANYASRSIGTVGNWKDTGTLLPDAGIAPTSGKVLLVFMDYVLKDPAVIDVVAANKGTGITADTESTEFTVPYTGANLIPGTDFDFGIIDKSNDKVVTNDYNYLRESNSSKIKVDYEYSTDNVTWKTGLPKDVGTYTIKVKVSGDDVTYNRQANTVELEATITPATVTIAGPATKNVSYGLTYGEIFDFSEYTAKNQSGATVSGTWSIDGADSTKVPDVGSYTNLKIKWQPSSADGRNYGTAEYPVTLTVTQRAVTVKIGSGTATYGENKFTSNDFITFENLPAADNSKTADWIANTTFTVEGANGTNEFAAGLPVGSYKLKINSTNFGGATNQNYSFSFTDGTLTVQKKDLYYTAEAAAKTYDRTKNVAVKLTYSTGIFGGDPYDNVYMNVPGTMASANAGENKVTVDTSNLDVNSNYNLVISNASTLKATVAKADPTGVAVVANPAVVKYNKTKTLNSIALDPTATELTGTWAWESANTVPHVNQNKYVAVFTPEDTTNYNTLKQDVTLTVEKKDVEVTVDAITVTYGDNVPVLTVKYNGFTGGDTLATIDYEGNAGATTTYTPGSGVDKKYPISVASTLESENYNFVKKDSTITVTPKALTVTAANDSIVYGTAAPEYNVSDVTATGFYGSDSLSSLNATVKVTTTYIAGTVTGKVGTYPINVEVTTANKNYNITTVAGTLTVTKAVLTVTPNAKTITFGAGVPEYNVAGTDYAVTGFVNGDTLARVTITGAPVFTTAYTSESFVNSYPVTAVVTNMSSGNYTFVGASGTIKVVKADPKVSTAPTATVVNSHSLADAAFSNTAVVVNPNDSAVSVPGVFAFTNSSAVPAWGSSNSYEAVFTPDDTINYNTVKVNVKVTVTVKTISGTPVIQGSAMAGSTLTVSLAAMDPSTASSYTYQWYVGNTAVATGSSYKIKEADIGKTIYVVLTAVNANGFTGNATSAATDAVIEALLETTAAQLNVVLPTGVVYDAMSHAATVTIKDGYNPQYFGNITVKYNGSTEAPTAAGTYAVTVDVSTPKEPAGGYPENTYYGPATGIAVGTITITRAPYTVTVLANDKVYDGTVTATATITGSGLKNETDVVYLADTARYSFANANAGANKPITVTNVTLLGKDAGNYEIVVEPTTAAILPRVIYYRASGVDKFYDGTNTVAVEFTYDAGKNGTNNDWGYATVDNASTVYLVNGTAVATDVNAGDGIIITNIKATPSGASSNNYEIRLSNEATATVNIKKAPVTLTTPVINGIVYDSTKPLSTIDLSHLNTAEGYWAFNDTTIVPSVKQKSYAATYYSKNANYEDATVGTITVNVTPKEVILTADNKTVTYGANAPTYTISASGFTGSDTLAMIGGNINATSTYAPGSDIGSYTIRITEALTRDNYTFVTREGYLTVAHATINVTATAVDKVYDGNTNVTVNFSKLSTATGVYVNDLGKVGLSFEKTTGQAKTANAGSTTVSYTAPTLIGEKAKNYQLNVTPKTGVLTVVIAKADLADVVFPENGQVEYGFDLTYATFEKDGIGDGTFEYENAKLIVPGDTGIHNTYKVIFTPTDPNYNTQEKVVTLNVIKCTLHYQVGISGKLQEGQTLTVVTTDLPAKATDFISYQWYRYDGEDFYAINGANGKNYVVTDKDVGYTLVVMTTFDGSSPYVFANGVTDVIKDAADFVGELEGIIAESDDTIKEMNLTFWQRLMNWLYRIIAVLTGVQLGGGLGLGG